MLHAISCLWVFCFYLVLSMFQCIQVLLFYLCSRPSICHVHCSNIQVFIFWECQSQLLLCSEIIWNNGSLFNCQSFTCIIHKGNLHYIDLHILCVTLVFSNRFLFLIQILRKSWPPLLLLCAISIQGVGMMAFLFFLFYLFFLFVNFYSLLFLFKSK